MGMKGKVTRLDSEMKFKKLNIYLVLVEKLPVLKTVYSIPLNVVFVFDAFALYSRCFVLGGGKRSRNFQLIDTTSAALG